MMINNLDNYCHTTPSGCVEWGRAKVRGYGVVWNPLNKRLYYVHRLMFERRHGGIRQGDVICHKCDNPACVNPDHLFTGTQAENLRDMKNKGRASGPKGAKNRSCKLDAMKVREIRSMIADGVSERVIAKRFQVERGTVRSIKHNRTWKYIS
jgi:HNH endonuclease